MNNAQLTDFFKNLAHKPYCADELLYGLKIRSKKIAVTMQYIQGNQPCMLHYLFFDIDRYDAVMAWHDADLPMPYWTAQTQKNGHAHICYKLEIPLCTSELASKKAISYAAKVQAGIAERLGADVGYSHLITKNPFHADWRTTFWTDKAYTLDYLADFVDLPKKLSKKQEVSGLGRNCSMFDSVRHWAYKAIRAHRGDIYSNWLEAVIKQCLSANEAFLEPLPYSEIKATAKSIAVYCWKKDAYHYQEFIDRQSRKGVKGGLKGGKIRSDQFIELRKRAKELKDAGKNNTQIANVLGVSRYSVIKWINT